MQVSRRPLQAATDFQQDLHPKLREILAARSVLTDAQLQLNLADLADPATLLGLDRAVQLLLRVLNLQQRLLVIADYDADGATSCALSLLGLRAMGFKHVDYLVPNRFTYGYGLTPPIVELARVQNPAVLMTVDNGIASHAGVELANHYGIDVLITDHHLPATTLPAATAIVNPNQPGCTFASKALAGVGVVFYLLLALRKTLREQQWFVRNQVAEPNLAQLLDLVALGTVADVATLDENNRRLVKHGLHLIRVGKARPGLLAILEIAGRNPALCVANDLGYAVGPRLNAAGRLDDMSVGIECLLAADPVQARRLAQQLDGLNRDRRLIEQDMQQTALQQVADLPVLAGDNADSPQVLCLYEPSWHQGVSGIVASRLKERYHCPVIVFADAGLDEQGQPQLKGSARSINGIHIRDVLDAVATRHPGLVEKFGGHAMAAGLSLAPANFESFRQALRHEVARVAAPELFAKALWHDGPLPAECLSLDFALLLRNVQPWGQGMPEPLFQNDFMVVEQRVLAEKHLKFTLHPEGTDLKVAAIAFNVELDLLQRRAPRVRLLYKLDINDYRGEVTPQLLIEHVDFLTTD